MVSWECVRSNYALRARTRRLSRASLASGRFGIRTSRGAERGTRIAASIARARASGKHGFRRNASQPAFLARVGTGSNEEPVKTRTGNRLVVESARIRRSSSMPSIAPGSWTPVTTTSERRACARAVGPSAHAVTIKPCPARYSLYISLSDHVWPTSNTRVRPALVRSDGFLPMPIDVLFTT
jgi:hypothetical protein